MFDILPPELIARVFEYDDTHHREFGLVLRQLISLKNLLSDLYYFSFETVFNQRFCKKLLRQVRKRDLRLLAKMTRTSLSKRFTKRRAAVAIVFSILRYPSQSLLTSWYFI